MFVMQAISQLHPIDENELFGVNYHSLKSSIKSLESFQ